MNKNLLWYDRAAVEWTGALPLGNGRLGAMQFGGAGLEEFQLNEDTLWSGGPYNPANDKARDAWPKVQDLVFQGRYKDADKLINETMMARPIKQMSYQPAGNLFIATGHDGEIADYRRELDINRAVSKVSYTHDGVTYQRESFISAVDQVLAVKFTAGDDVKLDLRLRLESEQPGEARSDANGITFTGRNRDAEGIEAKLRFAMHADVLGGDISPDSDGSLRVSGTGEFIILLDMATSFVRFDDVSGDPEALLSARRKKRQGKSWDQLRADHIQEYQSWFDRLDIDLGTTEQAQKPTAQRIAEFAQSDDPALAALYLQYGRYLMISSSRPGTQPANLQGIWNKETNPPWGSKYTVNINLEMNYWLPDPANLAECFSPLITLLEEVAETGAEWAKAHYGARGWVLHHNTDIWRAAGPVDGAEWGMWPMGGAWLCAQLWDHAAYAGFEPDLVQRIYPLIKGSAQFLLDYMTIDPNTGELVTNPSNSPENIHPFGTTIVAGPAMDNQITRDLFAAVIEASEILGSDAAFAEEVRVAREKLAPDRIGEEGQLQEWREDWDMGAPERDHRHVSHLYGLYPGFQINPDETPELTAAARRSLEIRGDNATGWGIGWRINLWARLRDGNHAHDVLTLLLSPERSYDNLFDAHPPFQIDGNFGGAVGIIEMLVQSRPGEIRLLPALPANWPDGRLKGVRTRCGVELDFSWQNGQVVDCRMRGRNGEIRLHANGLEHQVTVSGGSAQISANQLH